MTDRLPLSLVILTHQRRARVLFAVERALALPERPEIIVVDNGSSDGTADSIARIGPPVGLVRSPTNIGAAARNLGVAASSRPIVAFSDDDVIWEPGALARAAELFESCPRLGLATARVLVGPERREDPACTRMARSPLTAGRGASRDRRPLPGDWIPVAGFLANACVARREAFLGAGGYERRRFLGGEEALLAIDLLTAGWRVVYVPSLRARHFPLPTRDSVLGRRLLSGNRARVAWLRRPLSRALAITREELSRCDGLREALELLSDLCVSMPWVLRERRPVPAAIERALRRVERHEDEECTDDIGHAEPNLRGVLDTPRRLRSVHEVGGST